jgi:hypothetical protein
MKNGHCPMCNSDDVYTNSSVTFFASNNRLRLRDDDGNILPQASFVPYICKNCGFTAMYMQSMEGMEELLSKGWEKITA